MKRSRRSEYDKKRNRSKKHSERKFGFSSKTESKTSHADSEPAKDSTVNSDSTSSSTSSSSSSSPSSSSSNSSSSSPSTSNTIDRLQRFEVDENHEKKYTYREITTEKKSGCFNYQLPIAAVIIIFIIKLIIGIGRVTDSPPIIKEEPIIQKIKQQQNKRVNRLISKNPALLIYGLTTPMREVAQLKKDSLFPILPNVNVRLFKGFHLYNTSFSGTTQLLAKFSKYCFFYNRTKKIPNRSMTQQWEDLRKKLARRNFNSQFSYKDTKTYIYKGLQIEEKSFQIKILNFDVQGVATLVDAGDSYYFFHFLSKEKKGHRFDFSYLKKYLNYYLKIR